MKKLPVRTITAFCFVAVAALFVLIPGAEAVVAAIGCPLIEPEPVCIVFGKDWSHGRTVILDSAWWLHSAMLVLFPFTAFGVLAGSILMFCKLVPAARLLGYGAIGILIPFVLLFGTMISFMALVISLIDWDYRYRYSMFKNSMQRVEGVKAQNISYYEGKLYADEVWVSETGYVYIGVNGLASITKPAWKIFRLGDKKIHCDGPGISTQTLSPKFSSGAVLTAPEIVRQYEALDAYFEKKLSNTERSYFRIGQPERISVDSDCTGCRTRLKKKQNFAG